MSEINKAEKVNAVLAALDRQFRQEKMDGPYTVQVDNGGCEHCGAGKQFSVVFHNGQPDELAESTSWEDFDHACDVADGLNRAYANGVRDMRNQAIFTANAMRNLASEMDKSDRDIPVRHIRAILQHADDLMRAAANERP